MATLSAPNVSEPLYESARQVVVIGYVPGAMIAIYVIPPESGSASEIGGGVSFAATGQVFGVDAAVMVAGAKVYATQTFDGITSPPSPEVILQSALGVDPPRLTAPLLESALGVRVDGMLPGASAGIRDGTVLLGSASAYSGAIEVGVSPALVAGRTITARQVYSGATGSDSPGLTVTSVSDLQGQFLPTPEVQAPLYAGQQYAIVGGCIPGSQVELFVDTLPMAGGSAADTSVAFWISGGLAQGTAITARQHLCGRAIQSAMSDPIVVRPAADIPRPGIRGPLYDGDTSVVAAMTVAGQVVTIEADGIQVGMGGAGGGDASFNLDPPLIAGQNVVATVELCGVNKSSLPVIVRGRPSTIPPPEVGKPLYACSALVQVGGCLPGARVRVHATAATSILIGVAQTFRDSIAVGVTPLLQAGWQITATQEVGGVRSPHSDRVEVQPAPEPPRPQLRTPIYECARGVRVEEVFPGARVDVYQNRVWIGGADACTTEVVVGIYPPLTSGATITATQTLCGKISEPAQAEVSPAPGELSAPTISPAYEGASYITVGGLVPGATVEIEEISTYNLVIGKASATESTQGVWLRLPIFLGAALRARQRLCTASRHSPTVKVGQPPEWPLGESPFKAGFRVVTDIPISDEVKFLETSVGGVTFTRPQTNAAVIFYPATEGGEGTPVAAGGPFPLIVFGHARREPASRAAVCSGAPTDTTQDFRQLSGTLAHLARWGFVTISPDLSWLTWDLVIENRQLLLKDAVSHMLAQNFRLGSPFFGRIRITGLGAMGHSTGGLAAIYLATSGALGALRIDAMGLIAPAGGFTLQEMSRVSNFAPNPVLILHGTQDAGNYGVDGEPLSIYAAAAATKHLVKIGGANHFGYTDALCLQPPGDGTATISQADQQRIAKAYLTAFFRRYLSGATEVADYLMGARLVEELETFDITVVGRFPRPSFPVLQVSVAGKVRNLLDFGTVKVGQISFGQVTFGNVGGGSITISQPERRGDFTSDTQHFLLGQQATPNQGVHLMLVFIPTRTGSYSGQVAVRTSLLHRNSVEITLLAKVSGPKLEVSPTLLDFGSVRVGQAATRTITLRNLGDADAEIAAISPIGEFNPILPLPLTLPAGQSRNFPVEYRPTLSGPAQATLALRYVQPGSTFYLEARIVVQGHGAAPVISLDPAALDFGVVLSGGFRQLPLQIKNVGQDPLTVTNLFVSGYSRAFFVENPGVFLYPNLPLPIGARAQVIIQVWYYAGRPGERQFDELVVQSDDPQRPEVRLRLIGATDGPRIEVPEVVRLRAACLPALIDVPILNMGTTDLTVTQVVLGAARPSPFAIRALPPTPFQIAGGQRQKIEVEFNASQPGQYQDLLIVKSDDYARPQVRAQVWVTLIAAPCIEMPKEINFGRVSQIPAFEVVPIRNKGTADLTVMRVRLQSRFPVFAIPGLPATPFQIAGGQQQNLQIEFNAQQRGRYEAELTVESSDRVNPMVAVRVLATRI